MLWVAVGCEDCDFMASVLETDGGIYYQAFGTTDAQIGMEEDDVHIEFDTSLYVVVVGSMEIGKGYASRTRWSREIVHKFPR